MTVLDNLVTRSRLGLAMVCIRDDEEAAQATGINTLKIKLSALLISAYLAGLAGGVYAYNVLSTLGETHLIIFGLLFICVVLFSPAGLAGWLERIRQYFYGLRKSPAGSTGNK